MIYGIRNKFNKLGLSITGLVTTVEISLLAISFIWMFIRKIPVIGRIKPSPLALQLGAAAGIGLLLSGFLFYFIDKFFFKGMIRKMMEKDVYPLFSRVTFFEIVIIAGLSGFCEEFFFRGILMPEFGIITAGVIFGILHTPGRKFWFLGIWTAFVGIFLGLLYRVSGNLAIPMTAHFVNNFVALLFARYVFPAMANKNESPAETEKGETGKTPEDPEPEPESATDVFKEIDEKLRKEMKELEKGLSDLIKDTEELGEGFQEEFNDNNLNIRKTVENEKSPVEDKSKVRLLDPEMMKTAGRILEKEKKKSGLTIAEPEYEDLWGPEDDLWKDQGKLEKGESEMNKKEESKPKKPDNKQEKKTKDGKISIPKNRRADDIDSEGIGVVNEPQ